MKFFRRHWFDIAGIAGVIIIVTLLFSYRRYSNYQLLMWMSLVTLFFHQTEEYRMPGTFPGMINEVVFRSDLPDRYPLNSNTALIINVCIGWPVYLLSAVAGERFIWMGMASILVSLGNIIAHTFVFNIKGRTFYNAGLITCWILFVPCVFFFFRILFREHLATEKDFIIGIILGVIINIVGVFKPIQWLADRNTTYIFNRNQLLPKDRL